MACLETYATLRIFSSDLLPESITHILGIEATRTFRKGEPHSRGKLERKENGWFFSTEKRTNELADAKDFRQHLDLILEMFKDSGEAIKSLRARHCKMDICAYWVSDGQGGPELTPEQMLTLGTLGMAIWWDIYFRCEQ